MMTTEVFHQHTTNEIAHGEDLRAIAFRGLDRKLAAFDVGELRPQEISRQGVDGDHLARGGRSLNTPNDRGPLGQPTVACAVGVRSKVVPTASPLFAPRSPRPVKVADVKLAVDFDGDFSMGEGVGHE